MYILRSILLLLSMNMTVVEIQAQETKTQTSIDITRLNQGEGKWTIIQYPHQVIKVIFKPEGYDKTELISNAITRKPVSPQKINQSTLSKIHIEGYFQSGEFRGFKFYLKPGEQIFGGGERALPMNRRGYRFNLYNAPWYGYENGADNLNFSIPFFISSEGYGIFFDNPSKGFADIGKQTDNLFEAGFVSGELNFYFIPGKNIDEILQRYTYLTGRQPIPPRWALGNFMSRFGYVDQQQVKTIYERMKEENFPVDAIIFDLFWFGDSIKRTMGNLDWTNKEKWPDPRKMIADFKSENVKTILITEPFVLNTTPNYTPSKNFHSTDSIGRPFVLHDFYFGEGGLIDIFRPDAQQWFWSKYKQQIEQGVDAWWGDLGEPEKHPVSTYHNLKASLSEA